MSDRTTKFAILISAIVHILLVTVLLMGASFFGAIPFHTGTVGVVSVWITDDGGEVSGASGQQTVTKKNIGTNKTAQKTTQILNNKDGNLGQSTSINDGVVQGVAIGSAVDGSGGTGAGGGVIDKTLLKIKQKINAAKFYPKLAKDQGIVGAPKIKFIIKDNGEVTDLVVIASSGNNQLDEAALTAVRRAAPFPFYPVPIITTLVYSLER